jgi:hypothetical protein
MGPGPNITHRLGSFLIGYSRDGGVFAVGKRWHKTQGWIAKDENLRAEVHKCILWDRPQFS